MAITTSTVTLNAAFLQEIKDDNLELCKLLDDLRQMAIHPAGPPHHRRRFLELLGRLRDQLAMHFALEEAYGYFEDPTFVSARVSKQVAALRAQHAELFVEIRDLSDEAERLLYHDAVAGGHRGLEERFRAFDEKLQDHETRENELILQVLYQDIGVGD